MKKAEIWIDNNGDLAHLFKVLGEWRIEADDFDAFRKTKKEAVEQLKNWGYRLIGWE